MPYNNISFVYINIFLQTFMLRMNKFVHLQLRYFLRCVHGKNSFAEMFKSLARYRSENYVRRLTGY